MDRKKNMRKIKLPCPDGVEREFTLPGVPEDAVVTHAEVLELRDSGLQDAPGGVVDPDKIVERMWDAYARTGSMYAVLAVAEEASRADERERRAAQLEDRALELGQKMNSVEEGGIAHIGCGAAAHELFAQAAVMRAAGEREEG